MKPTHNWGAKTRWEQKNEERINNKHNQSKQSDYSNSWWIKNTHAPTQRHITNTWKHWMWHMERKISGRLSGVCFLPNCVTMLMGRLLLFFPRALCISLNQHQEQRTLANNKSNRNQNRLSLAVTIVWHYFRFRSPFSNVSTKFSISVYFCSSQCCFIFHHHHTSYNVNLCEWLGLYHVSGRLHRNSHHWFYTERKLHG